jgi:hypothetical protein
MRLVVRNGRRSVRAVVALAPVESGRTIPIPSLGGNGGNGGGGGI